MTTTVDRPAAIRRALRDLVAREGFHGASMSAVAKAAGVATGTAYVHYESKEELVHATYLEIKRELGDDVVERIDADAAPVERYRQIMVAIYRHLEREPEKARFLTQLEESPYYESARSRLAEQGDRLAELAGKADFVDLLAPLPQEAVYALTMGVAVRLVSSGVRMDDSELDTVVDATWRAVTRPPHDS